MAHENDHHIVKSKTAAERDAQFLEKHPLEGNVVRVGAGFVGAGEAISKGIDETKSLVNKMTEPGDQNPANMPHPLDVFEAGIAKIAESGDMNISNAPHPVDKAIAAANSKLTEIGKAGVFEGTRIGAEFAVGAIIESAGPKGKLNVAEKILEEVGDTTKGLQVTKKMHHIEGELVDADIISPSKELLIAYPMESSNALARAKNKVLDIAENIPVVKDFMAPSLENRIVRQAFKETPSASQYLDEKYRIGGDAEVLMARHDDKVRRAEVLAEMVKSNPEATAKNRNISNDQISQLINDPQVDQKLGLHSNPNSVPKLPSPEQQVHIDSELAKKSTAKQNLANELAYQDSLPPLKKFAREFYVDNANPESGFAMGPQRYGGSIMDHLKVAAADTESEARNIMLKSAARGAVQVAAVPILGVNYALSKSDNEISAAAFNKNIGSSEGRNELLKEYKGAKNVVDHYLLIENHLTQDGRIKLTDLDNQAKETLKNATGTISKQLESQGFESFGDVSKSNEQHKATNQDLSRN